jgi:hypothetical protein
MTPLEKLLSKLPSPEKSGSTMTYEGKAVSRDKDNLHLAISSGVIAIPLADIGEVKELSGQSADIVSVSVKSAERIKQVRHASARVGGGIFGGGIFGGGIFGGFGGTPSNGHYVDCVTVSGGIADQTDDTHWIEVSDDEWT